MEDVKFGVPRVQCDLTDDEILERHVFDVLQRHHFEGLRSLGVQVLDGVVTIRGTVDSFYEKQVAISKCRQVDGVRRLNDKIEVQYLAEQFRPRTSTFFNRPR